MKASDARGGRCPVCTLPTSVDRKGRGWVRRLRRKRSGRKCSYGWTQKD
jgi:hypothetical protein